jgi:hypothetical protein
MHHVEGMGFWTRCQLDVVNFHLDGPSFLHDGAICLHTCLSAPLNSFHVRPKKTPPVDYSKGCGYRAETTLCNCSRRSEIWPSLVRPPERSPLSTFADSGGPASKQEADACSRLLERSSRPAAVPERGAVDSLQLGQSEPINLVLVVRVVCKDGRTFTPTM